MAGHLSNSEICPIFYMWVLWKKKKKLHMNNITDDKKNLNKGNQAGTVLYLITII